MSPSSRLKPPGIPRHIDILCQIRKLLEALDVFPNNCRRSAVNRGQKSCSGPISKLEMDHAMEELIDRIESTNKNRNQKLFASIDHTCTKELREEGYDNSTSISQQSRGRKLICDGCFRLDACLKTINCRISLCRLASFCEWMGISITVSHLFASSLCPTSHYRI